MLRVLCVLCHAVQDLHGMCAFLHLEPLDDRALFVRTLERPVKQRDPLGLKRLQVSWWCGRVQCWARGGTGKTRQDIAEWTVKQRNHNCLQAGL